MRGCHRVPPGSWGTPRWASWGTPTPGWGSWGGTGQPVDLGAPRSRATNAGAAQGVPGLVGHPHAAPGGPGWQRVPTCHGALPRRAGGPGVAPATPWVMRQPHLGLGWQRAPRGSGAPSRRAAGGRGGLNLGCPGTAPPRRAVRPGAAPGSPRTGGSRLTPGHPHPERRGAPRAGTEVSGWHPRLHPTPVGPRPTPRLPGGRSRAVGGRMAGRPLRRCPPAGSWPVPGGAARPRRPRRAAGSSSRRRPGAWHGWARARARVGSARRCPRLRGAEPSPRRALSRGGRSAPRAGPAV